LSEDRSALYRTEFFIGLGWLVARKWYKGAAPGAGAGAGGWEQRWPFMHWDHWLRDVFRADNLECVYPEVSRNFNIGACRCD
jgi:hypothetical protein